MFSSDLKAEFQARRLIAAKRQHFPDSRSPIGAPRLFPMDSICVRELEVAAVAGQPIAYSQPAALMAFAGLEAVDRCSIVMVAKFAVAVVALRAEMLCARPATIVSLTNPLATNSWRWSLTLELNWWNSSDTAGRVMWTPTNWCLDDTATCCLVQHFRLLNLIWKNIYGFRTLVSSWHFAYTYAKPRRSGFVSVEFGVKFICVVDGVADCNASGSVLKPSGYDIEELVASFVWLEKR